MIIQNLRISLRALRKNSIYSAINIFGLAIGIASCLLIYRILRYELSFNTGFRHYDRIVRVLSEESNVDGVTQSPCVPVPAMNVLEQSVGQFEHMARIREVWPTLTLPNPAGGAPLKKIAAATGETGMFVEPSFFQVFDLKWLSGDPATALLEPNTTVLPRRTAEKLFDSWQNAVGKTVVMDNRIQLSVRGVVDDLPDNCDFPLYILVSYPTLKPNSDLYFYEDKDWGACSSNNQVFGLLRDENQFDAATASVALVGEQEYKRIQEISGGYKKHVLQRLSDMHYNLDVGHSGTHSISRARLGVLAAIGLLVLIMACFNFINLATALASLRAREVGVRKSLGGNRLALIGQFMAETSLIVLFSLLLGALMAKASAPLLKHVSDVPDSLPFLSDPSVLLFLGATLVTVSVLSGLYPSLVLAGFNPVRALKNEVSATGGTNLRRTLVIAQFIIAQALIVGTLVTIGQMNYIRNLDLGYTKDLVYTFAFSSDSSSQAKLNGFKERLQQIPSVEAVSFNSDQPSSGNTWSSNFALGRGAQDARFSISLKFCDADYLKTYGLRMKAGRWLEPSDTMREVVVNEATLRKLGIANAEEVIGKEMRIGGRRYRPIVGVVQDFHAHSVRENIEPLLLSTRKQFYWEAGVKIQPGNIEATTAAIRRVYDETFPAEVFDPRFLDERIARFYQDEDRFTALCKAFALIAILISCMGLFGLASHAAARRTKEIGIRKVLGAGVADITGLLARDFLLLVVVAFVIATPIAWYAMQQWLADFAYRVNLSWWMFAGAGLAAVLIAGIAVSYQSIRAALANPVRSLRSE